MGLALATTLALPAMAAETDWKKVDQVFACPAAVSGTVHRYGLPRSDLKVTLDGVQIKPGLALGGWIAFEPMAVYGGTKRVPTSGACQDSGMTGIPPIGAERCRLAQMRAPSILPRPPRVTVIERAAWLLGDMVVGSTNVSVALAVGIRGAAEIDHLIEGLGRRKLLDHGLLLVGGCQLPAYVSAATRYAAVALEELAAFENGSVCVDRARLGAWIRGSLRGSERPIKSGGGRLSTKAQVLSLFDARRGRGERYVSKQSEAKAIRREWPSMYPDEAPPVGSTIRGYLPDRVL